ncbi:VanW family protein [Demequina aestuarii]|uniref:VanW family protein n=1 Tax=Demequina aestuarii TaxID=327095 RepID=UPI000781AB17|nr:VanW family protein [Demequina aestuarii]
MARGKDHARKLEEEQARRRRNSVAHRSLRRRAEKGTGARSASATPTSDAPIADAPFADEADATDAPLTAETPVSPAASPDGDPTALSGDAALSNDAALSDDAADADDSAVVADAPVVERVPTSELTAPVWLAEGEAADAGDDADAPADEPAHAPAQSDEHPGASDATDSETEDVDAGPLAASDGDAGIDAWRPESEERATAPERASVFSPPSESPESSVSAASPEPEGDQTAVLPPVDDTAVMAPMGDDSPAPGHEPRAATIPPGQGEPHPESSDSDGHVTRRKKRRTAWVLPLALVAIAVLYVGAQALLSNTVPRGTEVLGLEIGGMSTTEATGAVGDTAAALEAEDLELRAVEESFALPASDAGLSVDVDTTIAQVTGFTVMPDRLWAHIAGGGPLTPVTDVDQEALAEALESAAVQLDGPAQDAGVTVADGSVGVVPGRSSVTIDQEESAARLAQAWPATQAIDLIAETEPPTITDEDAAAFAAELETETFAAPITLVGEDAEATIEPATIASTSTVEAGPSGLELVVDGTALAAQIIEANPDLTTEGENASVSFDDSHDIVIDEGSPGITIDGEALGEAVVAAAGSADRLADLPYTAADPEVSAEDLGLADFAEIISSFDTPLTAEPIRTQNLRVAAADVEGVIVKPGDTFDLTEVLSPINEEEGYRPAHVIVNGILTNGMGGGLSQMATTTYNAGYFAGFEILDHRPHSVWFTRYPAGRESTIYTGSINVEFRNNTPYAAVFNSYIAGGRLHVDVWSTEHFEVSTSASPKRNVKQPGVKEVTSANCEAKGPGQPGFTITNTRTVSLDGEVVEETSDTWTYKPDDAIECVSDDDEDDE